ncbi:MAG: hypothetical protein AB1758_21075 [Candidatus Eremiobacterota bacterium]
MDAMTNWFPTWPATNHSLVPWQMPQTPLFMGPPVTGWFYFPGLSGPAPGSMYSGSMLSQAVGGSIGTGGWGSYEAMWPVLLGLVAGCPELWPQPERSGCPCNGNTLWAEWERFLGQRRGKDPAPKGEEPKQPRPREWQPKPGQNLSWAAGQVEEHFDLLDTASGHDRDGLVTREDVQSLLEENPDAPPELRDACRLLLRNGTFFNALDAASGGTPDGKVSLDDAQRANEVYGAIPERAAPDSMSPAAAAEVLERYLPMLDRAKGGEADGLFGREDLAAVLESPDAPAELREAARYALQNDYAYNAFDASKNGELDDKVGAEDLQLARQRLADLTPQSHDGPMTEAVAARTLLRYLPLVDQAAGQGNRDEKIGRADLEALAASPDLPPDLRQAVDYLVNNPAIFNHFDQAGDSNGNLDREIGLAGLRQLGGDTAPEESVVPEEPTDPVEEPVVPDEPTDPVEEPVLPDEPTDPVEEPVLPDEPTDPVEEPVVPEEPVATETPGEWVPQPGQDLTWAAGVVANNFEFLDTAAGGDRDERVRREDLQAVLDNNPDVAPELRDACRLLLRNSTYFNAVDAATGGTPDGKISLEDARRAVETYSAIPERPAPESMSPAAAAEILNHYLPLLDRGKGGEADGFFGQEDLAAVLESPDAPAELREAARYALQNAYVFHAFDSANNGKLDDKVGADDLRLAQERLGGLTPENLEGPMTDAQAARTLRRYLPLVDLAAGEGRRDDKIGLKDLQAMAASPDLPPDLRQAVDYLVANEAVFNYFDQAGDSNGNLDDEIGIAGLDLLAAQGAQA